MDTYKLSIAKLWKCREDYKCGVHVLLGACVNATSNFDRLHSLLEILFQIRLSPLGDGNKNICLLSSIIIV